MRLLLVGFGSLGIRHLQSLINLDAQIDVLEPYEFNITENSKEINNLKKVFFYQDSSDLNRNYDVCIISTSSKPRLKVILELQRKIKWNYLILEKFLFPSIGEYEIFENEYLYDLKNVNVNCPRRYYEGYQNIKLLNSSKDLIGIDVRGNNWGMSTNGIHFLDLFQYFASEKLSNVSVISLEKITSKRDGYDELVGELFFKSQSKYIRLLSTNDPAEESFEIKVKFRDHVYIINEIQNELLISTQDRKSIEPFNTIFQSNLTEVYVNDLVTKGLSSLPTYLESRHDHQIFLEAIASIKNISIT